MSQIGLSVLMEISSKINKRKPEAILSDTSISPFRLRGQEGGLASNSSRTIKWDLLARLQKPSKLAVVREKLTAFAISAGKFCPECFYWAGKLRERGAGKTQLKNVALTCHLLKMLMNSWKDAYSLKGKNISAYITFFFCSVTLRCV